MLVLSRRTDESVRILVPGYPEPFEVRVVDIRGDKVRLGITAPKRVSIHRQEVLDRILSEKEAMRDPQPKTPDPARPGNP